MKKIIAGLKILIISVLCAEIMIYLHKITALESIDAIGLSRLADHFGAATAAFMWGISAYYIVSVVYAVVENDLEGGNIKKAILFGGLLGGSWWLGMIEMDQTLNNLIMGLVDGFMIASVCIMIAFFVLPKHRKMDHQNHEKQRIKDNIRDIFIVASVFSLNRLIFGLFLGKYYDSMFDYILIPIYALYTGFMWTQLKNMAGNGRGIKKALKYGVVIWGIPSGIFMYFLVFLFKDMLIGITIRNIFDMFFMTLAVWLTMKLKKAGGIKV